MIRSAHDALVVVRSVGKTVPPGTNTIVFLDADGRFVTNWSVVDSDDGLEEVVAVTCQMAPVEATAAFLVSNRTGQEPADRPDDESRWQRLGEIAEDSGVDLLDWLVVWGRAAFSLAEHAPVAAGWPSTVDAVTEHPELRLDPERAPAPHKTRRGRRRGHRR